MKIGLASALLALGLVSACYTPSVPLPPPLVENMRFASAPTPGMVIMSSPAQSKIGSVRFYVFNRSKQVGVIAQSAADGSFVTEPFRGDEGDYVQIYYELGGGELSSDVCTTLSIDAALIGATCH